MKLLAGRVYPKTTLRLHSILLPLCGFLYRYEFQCGAASSAFKLTLMTWMSEEHFSGH